MTNLHSSGGDHRLVVAELFSAPSTEGALDHLLSFRESVLERIQAIVGFTDCARTALNYFLDAAYVKRRDRGGVISATELLDEPSAIAALDADLWSKAMKLTDVYDCMPQARRDEWNEQIRDHKTPPFTKENIAATFDFLLSSRAKFFAERVDGIFRALSRTHVTNQPEGFGKRMIIPYVLSEWGDSPDHRQAGTINDLRCVIARFMGRDEPHWCDSDRAIRVATERAGKWVTFDGGALRMRVYTGVRTAHLEVHPDMAWRLNAVLASLHPAAIPSQFREPPKRKAREFNMMQQPLPFAVLGLLRELQQEKSWGRDRRGEHVCTGTDRQKLVLGYGTKPDKAQRKRLDEVLAAIGGVPDGDGWRFDYEPGEVISEILCLGCIPDAVSHQFYPTPADIAEKAVALAVDGAGAGDRWLEPSAGTGNLAALFPDGANVECVEVSALHAAVLRARGFSAIKADFLKVPRGATYDRIVMNPPFSEGRWQAHLDHAAGMLAPDGRLVAILPVSARKCRLLPNLSTRWGEVFRFPGTSVEVSILVANP